VRGAESMLIVQDRKIRKVAARGSEEGIGMRARKMPEGRCVNTIVFMFPKRLAIEDARSMETALMAPVTKKMVPSFPSERENLSLKKKVIHDLEAR
jgi:hypothetical protein